MILTDCVWQDLGYQKSEIGALGSVYALAFAIAKLTGGIAADYYSRYMIPIGTKASKVIPLCTVD